MTGTRVARDESGEPGLVEVALHPRISVFTLAANWVLRCARVIADAIPINTATMTLVNIILGAPMAALSWRGVVETHRLGAIRVDVVRHPSVVDPESTIMHIHGGGFVFGSTRSHRFLAMQISRSCEAEVVLFDYRLLPKVTARQCLDDCLAVYRWVIHRRNNTRVVVSGDSAGGNLLVSLMAELSDHPDLPLPAAAVGMSAWLDTSYRPPRGAPRDAFFSTRFADRAARLAVRSEDLCPLERALVEFPPTLLQLGADEPVRPGNERLAELLAQVGVYVEVHAWRDQPHVFQALAPFSPEARAALDQMHAFIAEAQSDPTDPRRA